MVHCNTKLIHVFLCNTRVNTIIILPHNTTHPARQHNSSSSSTQFVYVNSSNTKQWSTVTQIHVFLCNTRVNTYHYVPATHFIKPDNTKLLPYQHKQSSYVLATQNGPQQHKTNICLSPQHTSQHYYHTPLQHKSSSQTTQNFLINTNNYYTF